ncbi:MAG: hypothetical protein ACTSPB_10935 [Candidatus Thorarchaeota archaeon]
MEFEEELRQLVPKEAVEFVYSVIDELSKRGFSKDDVWSKMKEFAQSEYVRKSYADNPLGLWAYAADATKAVIRRQSGGEAVKVDAVIPIGVSPLRTTSQGKRSSIFAVIKNEGQWKLDEIVFRGSLALTVDKIPLYKVYTGVTLTFRGYFYEANVNTKFNSATGEIGVADIIKKLKIRKVTMTEMRHALSRVDENGYVDRTDLRAFEAYVSEPWKKITDEKHIARYDATDNTLEESDVGEDGTIVKPYIAVWCHPMFARWGEGSKLLFIGTLEKRRDDGVVQMNAIYVKPIVPTSYIE